MQPLKYNLRLSRNDVWFMDRPHFHEDVELLLCLSNEGDFFIGNELYPLRRGAIFLINEATLHKSIAKEVYERYILHISPVVLGQLSSPQSDFLNFFRMAGRCAFLGKEDTSEVIKLLDLLEHPCDEGFGGDVRQTMVMLRLLLKLSSCFEAAQPANNDVNPDFIRVAPMLDYIQDNIQQTLTLDAIASRFFINKYHLCHIFKSATGFSVIEYIIHSRVLKARELLRNGMRVQEAGEMVGFQNNQHFIRTFGALTGTSPKRYAKEYLAGDKR